MASKSLFQSVIGALAPKAPIRNEAGGLAYELSPRHALAQYASTGCLNQKFYASAEDQLQQILKICQEVPPISSPALRCIAALDAAEYWKRLLPEKSPSFVVTGHHFNPLLVDLVNAPKNYLKQVENQDSVFRLPCRPIIQSQI